MPNASTPSAWPTVVGHAIYGTIVVVRFEARRILIAADSRHNYGSGAISHNRDDACKVVALGEHAAFVAAGFVGYDNAGPADRLQTWRASEVALLEYERHVHEHGGWSDAQLDVLARSIGDSLTSRIADLAQYAAPTVKSAVVGGLLTTGLLATALGNEVSVALIQIGVGTNGQVMLLPSSHLTPATHPISALGRGEVVVEVLAGSTQRAVLAMQELQTKGASLPPSERDVLCVTRLVELSIAWLPADASVGGPVDVLELCAEQPVRWIQRKS
jgi:hypothetical protein